MASLNSLRVKALLVLMLEWNKAILLNVLRAQLLWFNIKIFLGVLRYCFNLLIAKELSLEFSFFNLNVKAGTLEFFDILQDLFL